MYYLETIDCPSVLYCLVLELLFLEQHSQRPVLLLNLIDI